MIDTVLSSTRCSWDHPDPCILTVTVDKKDTDALGHTNNTRYLIWLEAVSWQHSEQLKVGLAHYQKLQKAMVVIRHEIDYLAPSYCGETLYVGTWLLAQQRKSRIKRHFQIIRAEDDATIVRCLSYYTCVDLQSHRPCKIPLSFLKAYGLS